MIGDPDKDAKRLFATDKINLQKVWLTMAGNTITVAHERLLWLPWVAAIPVAVLLLLSSYGHLDNSFRFLSTVYSYKLVSPWIGVIIAALLPAFQLTLGLALLFVPTMRRTAFGFCILLFAVFVGVQSITLWRGLDISCGCFGSSRGPIGTVSIGFAAIGFILSIMGYIACKRFEKNFPIGGGMVTTEEIQVRVNPDNL